MALLELNILVPAVRCDIDPLGLGDRLKKASLPWQSQPTWDTCNITDWHPHSVLAMEVTPAASLSHDVNGWHCVAEGEKHMVKKIHIYTDGSAVDGKSAWAFLVLAENAVGSRFRVSVLAGDVVLDKDHAQFVGASQHDCYDAELSAIIWPLYWIAQMAVPPPVEIHYDSVSAAMAANGTWKAKARHAIVQTATTLHALVSAITSVSF